MKKEVLKHVILMTKLITIAFGIQCLTMGLLLAWNGNGHVKSESNHNSRQAIGIAQSVDVIVSGTVTDINGEPIPGMTVSVPGKTPGTATYLGGQYTLTVTEGRNGTFVNSV